MGLGVIVRGGGLITLCHSSGVILLAEGFENVSWPWLSPLRGWGSLTKTSIGKFVYIANHFIFVRLNPFKFRVDIEGW